MIARVAGGACYAEILPMANIEITLPDGSKQSVAAGTAPLDIARSISPRLADAAIVAKVNGELYDLTRPLEKDASLQILTNKDPESLEVYRHSTAHLLAAAVLELYPETKLGIGPPDRQRLLLRFRPRHSVHARRPGKDREEDVGDSGAPSSVRTGLHREGRGTTQVRRCLDEVRADHRARRRDFQRVHAGTALHRFLPRPARAQHGQDQGVQAALDRRRLLERRRAQQAAAAHLRHRLLQPQGPGGLPQAGGGGQEARSSQAGQGTGPVQHSGTGRSRADLLPSQGRHHPQAAGRLDARPVSEARLLAGVHAARGALRPLEDLRPRELLRAATCSAGWNWTTPNTSSSR